MNDLIQAVSIFSAALAVALALVASEGAGPLLAAAFGLLAARALFMRRYRGLA